MKSEECRIRTLIYNKCGHNNVIANIPSYMMFACIYPEQIRLSDKPNAMDIEYLEFRKDLIEKLRVEFEGCEEILETIDWVIKTHKLFIAEDYKEESEENLKEFFEDTLKRKQAEGRVQRKEQKIDVVELTENTLLCELNRLSKQEELESIQIPYTPDDFAVYGNEPDDLMVE